MNINQLIKTGGDESYTYPNLVRILIPFIEQFKQKLNKQNITIWCPFDLENDIEVNNIKYYASNYVKIFKEQGYKVISSHILTGQDFFEYEPNEDWDIIISNPPFKNKVKFFKRALSFNKPFALVSSASWLNDGGVNKVFKNYQNYLALIIPNRRARFFNNDKKVIGDRPSFKAIYYCYKFIDKGLYFVDIEKEEV